MRTSEKPKVAGPEADELHRLRDELERLRARRGDVEVTLDGPRRLTAELATLDRSIAAAAEALQREADRQRLAERQRRLPEHKAVAVKMIEALKQLRRAVEAEAELIDELDRSCGFSSPLMSATPNIGNEGRGGFLTWIDKSTREITEYVNAR
jgi:hypothetical protein